MRYLGLDLGTKTLGIAISDVTHTIASSLKILRFEENNYKALYEDIKKIVLENNIEKIVLGLPKNMNNSVGPRAQITMDFGKNLSKYLNMNVIFQDERLSTVEATNYLLDADMSRKKRKQKIDSVAASIILQTYLDKEKGMKKDE